jgi:hypothetical protein
LAVCDRGAIDPEAVDCPAVDRRLFGVVPVRPHAEGAARDPDHIGVTGRLGGSTLRPDQRSSVQLLHRLALPAASTQRNLEPYDIERSAV